MVKKKATLRVSTELSIYLRYLHQDQNVSIRSLSRRYPQLCLPTIWRHATEKDWSSSEANEREGLDINPNSVNVMKHQ